MIYVNVMKRPADGAGVAFWTRQLSEGKRTRGGVMVGFSESQEYRRLTSHEVQATVLVNSLTRSYKDPATPTTASEEDITKSKQVARLGLDSVTIAAVPTRVAMWLDARSYLPVEEPTPVLTSGDNANRWPANNESFAYTFTVVTTSAAYLAGITK